MSSALRPARGIELARPQAVLVAVLLVLAALAWGLTGRRTSGMSSGPGADLGAVGLYTGMWVTMMAAMMFPSIAPMVVVYDRLRASRRARGAGGSGVECTALFVGGYLVTWTVAGLAAYVLLEAARAAEVGTLAWERAGRELAAAVVLAGGAYQLTPIKDVCLKHCRGPFSFVLEHWHEGRGGALRMGAIHGWWCMGCCWALMATLFALGVMSLGWMALVAALIAIEKLVPRRRAASRAVAIVLLALGLAMLLAPGAVPGLDDPASPAMEM
jgi:predicted metal-binding membrane protein